MNGIQYFLISRIANDLCFLRIPIYVCKRDGTQSFNRYITLVINASTIDWPYSTKKSGTMMALSSLGSHHGKLWR